MSAFANRFPASHKQSHHIQNIFTTFTIPEYHVRENSSNWKLLVTTARKHCTDYADIRHAFSWKHVGHLLWLRHDNADYEMPFVSLMTLWTFLGSSCLMVVNISQNREQSQSVTWYLTYYDALNSWYMQSRIIIHWDPAFLQKHNCALDNVLSSCSAGHK